MRSELKGGKVIYFIRNGEDGPIKVGYTEDNAEYRLKSLQTGNPDELTLLGEIYGSKDDERKIHKKFEKHKLRGEWFNPENDLLSFISNKIEKADLMEINTQLIKIRHSLDLLTGFVSSKLDHDRNSKPKTEGMIDPRTGKLFRSKSHQKKII